MRNLLTLGFAGLLYGGTAAAQDGRYIILGEGNTTCGEWTDLRTKDRDRIWPEQAWLLGFVTAIAHEDSAVLNLTKGVNGSAVTRWTDNYCRDHPLDNINEAAAKLVAELTSRAKQR